MRGKHVWTDENPKPDSLTPPRRAAKYTSTQMVLGAAAAAVAGWVAHEVYVLWRLAEAFGL